MAYASLHKTCYYSFSTVIAFKSRVNKRSQMFIVVELKYFGLMNLVCSVFTLLEASNPTCTNQRFLPSGLDQQVAVELRRGIRFPAACHVPTR